MSPTPVSAVDHEPFCTSRPGQLEPRMESYRLPRYSDDGKVTGQASIDRCIECGAQTVQG